MAVDSDGRLEVDSGIDDYSLILELRIQLKILSKKVIESEEKIAALEKFVNIEGLPKVGEGNGLSF